MWYNSRMTIVAFSGGRDSVALLHYLHTQGRVTAAVHVHHGLQSIADEWVLFAQSFCQQYHIPLHVEYVNIDKNTVGIEAAAREARYEKLIFWAKHYHCSISTGHHADDNDETIIHQLLRGTGLKGLAGIQTRSLRDGVVLERPLLHWRKADMTAYCVAHDLPWIEDPSNTNGDDYARNYIRQLLPTLTERFPTVPKALERIRHVSQDSLDLLDDLARIDLQTDQKTLSIKPLLALSDSRQRNAWRYWLQMNYPSLRYGDNQLKEWMKKCQKPDPKSWVHEGYTFTFKKWQLHIEDTFSYHHIPSL